MKVVLVLLLFVALLLAALAALRLLDRRADDAEWRRLARFQPADPERFSPEMVADLPEPARRFFTYAITPGTPVRRVAVIEMEGRFSLGTKDVSNYRAMEARQILAAPEGFLWIMRMPGAIPISGSDSGSWTRFRILNLIPVARAGGDADHTRSAFGRYVSEAVFWTPAALLPGPGITWEAVDADTARVTIRREDLEQAVDVSVDSEGRPTEVSFERWTDANPEKTFRLQPFGAVPDDFRDVEGYRLPFRVEAGNMFGTEDYFPFFIAEVTSIRFPAPDM